MRIVARMRQKRTPCNESTSYFVLKVKRKIPAQQNMVIPRAIITASTPKAVQMIDSMTDEAAVMMKRRMILNGYRLESPDTQYTRIAAVMYVTTLAMRAPTTISEFLLSIREACTLSTSVVINTQAATGYRS